MEGAVAPNVGEVTSTGSQGYQQEMNLRSVFSAEQQRILQRYYDNGMTNQSKSCFQLILQCAQETKLDFSVVRTWVGNKRRKMSSKTYVETGGQLQGSVSNSPSRPQEVTVRTVPNISRSQQPPRTSSGGDHMMTCVYSPNNSSARPGTTAQTTTPKADLMKAGLQRAPVRTETEYHKLPAPVHRQAPVVKAPIQPIEEKTLLLSRQQNVANTTNPMYVAKKNYVGSGQMVERIVPQKTMTWPVKNIAEAPGVQRGTKPEQPNISPIPHLSSAQRPREPSCGLKNLEIREVFSLAPGEPSSRTFSGALEERPRPPESTCFSIAMETGDVNDEYAREEELASMGAQNQLCSRFRESNSSPRENRSALSPVPVRTVSAKILQPNTRDPAENTVYHNSDYYMSLNTSAHNTSGAQYPGHNATRSSMHRHYSIAAQPGGMLPNPNNYQLQDRTQFSDHDLAMLKKYWDNGMTSLGSVCREKIEAVASELNVDCEIVRTWIGNRRRKYRLMGIEVPPPRGGPATFPDLLESSSSLTPSEDPVAGVVEDNDRHDEVSICLSEESSQADDVHEVGRNEDLSIKEDSPDMAPPHTVKVEAPEEEMSETMGNLDLEQMRSLLDYKNEEVRYMESEVERYKQKYAELQTFTRNLIHAVRTNDRDQQQILVTDPPLDLEDMDYSHTSPDPDDTSYSISSMSEKNNPDSV
ncbi:highly divergent homeobox isoform X2 [Hyla sarda]|uniref:highly divergent homeobox isoform X2 n=1 Tax=Hyla sarda TaxID=327740 RepID=UPI0024C2CD69|nr:highly divergent homeobox isoform X2 [Hyla sarda]